MQFNTTLQSTIEQAIGLFDTIPDHRKSDLEKAAVAISTSLQKSQHADLVFICTHNSRRSHLGQLWAQVAAHYYGYDSIRCFSGGTEATAFDHRAVQTLREAGLEIKTKDTSSNPVYRVKIADDRPSLASFSKKYTHPENPQTGFVAILVCSAADEACPFVPGADARFTIPYEDPKLSDDTDQEAFVYRERSSEIAREMFYLVSRVSM
jgi:arsenate reductase